MSIEEYREFYRRSVEEPERFWAEQARFIDWHREWNEVLDFSNPPFAKWFVGGETNLCHNALDRHLAERSGQDALVYISTETEEQYSYTYRELCEEVNALAAALRELGVGRGDRVIIYMPMIP
jgi:propionyl-CoA synthetase